MKARTAAVLFAVWASVSVGGCSSRKTGAAGGADSSAVPGERNANPAKLELFMFGDAPRDLPRVAGEVNRMAAAELGCTVSFNYTTGSDYMQHYYLLLSSGQPIDLIFTSDWLNYNQFARKGAFLPLETLLQRYTPELYKYVPESYWDAVRVNGHIYTIPAIWNEYVDEGIMYREDLRKKYRLPIPDSLANIEAYLEGVRRFEPSRNLSSEMVVDDGSGPYFTAMSVLTLKYRWVDQRMPYGLRAEYDHPTELLQYWGSKDFIEDMKMFKRWADKGFWTKGSLLNKSSLLDSFMSDNSVAVMNSINPVKYIKMVSLIATKDPTVQVGFFPYGRATRLVKPVHPIHNGFAIPYSARHPELALKFYEKLVLDERYNKLTNYGIEGVHYMVGRDGYYEMIGDVDTNGFPREAMNSWAWRNPAFMLYDRSFQLALDLFAEFDTYAVPDLYLGFVEDYSSYQAERAALHQVQSQYLAPIEAGFVDDVEKAVAVYMEQAEIAGLSRITAEYRRQWLAYCREKGYGKE